MALLPWSASGSPRARVLIRVGGPPNRWGGPHRQNQGHGGKNTAFGNFIKVQIGNCIQIPCSRQLFPSKGPKIPATGVAEIGSEPASQLIYSMLLQRAVIIALSGANQVISQANRTRRLFGDNLSPIISH